MASEVLLEAIRIEYTTLEAVLAAHAEIFRAWRARLDRVQVITSKANDGSSAGGQVVVERQDYEMWLEALQGRKRELEAVTSGLGQLLPGVEHVNFSGRYIDP